MNRSQRPRGAVKRIVPGARKKRKTEATRPEPELQADVVELPQQGPALPQALDSAVAENEDPDSRDIGAQDTNSKPTARVEELKQIRHYAGLARRLDIDFESTDEDFGKYSSLAKAIHWYAQDFYRSRGMLSGARPRQTRDYTSGQISLPQRFLPPEPAQEVQIPTAIPTDGMSSSEPDTESTDGDTYSALSQEEEDSDRKSTMTGPKRPSSRLDGHPDMKSSMNQDAMLTICAYIEESVVELLGDYGQT